MRARTAWLLPILLASALAAVPAAAQDPGASDPLPSVDLPVNLERMKRQLATLPDSDAERSLLRLDFYISVYGRAPAINPLEGFDLHNGPVPFGAPTRDDLQALWTPEEFSAPVADLTKVLGWLLRR